MEKCGLLTVGQHNGDRFLLRRFHFTGTLVADVSSVGDNASSHLLDETNMSMSMLFEKCDTSWFGRQKLTKYIQQGSVDEPFIAQRLQKLKWVNEGFEVGMLQSKHGGPCLVVSHDARIVGTVGL